MRCIIGAAALAALAFTVAAAPALAQTKVVVPPGSKTTVTRTPAGDKVITVTVNNEAVAFPEESGPLMFSSRVMVPLRGVVEKLGGSVLWDPKDRVVTGARSSTKDQFRIRVGSNEALLNGRRIDLDAPPRIVRGTTYVPLRFVSEALGARVAWNNETRTVIINGGG